MNARKLVIEQALSNGHNFLLKNQAQTEDPSYAKQEENLVARAAANLQVQLEHVESQWLELNDNSNKWERTIHNILEVCALVLFGCLLLYKLGSFYRDSLIIQKGVRIITWVLLVLKKN